MEIKEKINLALLTMLKPLVRVLIRNEVTHAEFTELSKSAYVESAYEQFSIPGRKTTIARVAVLTGLSRKEVVRLNKLRDENKFLGKPTPNRAMRVVNGWLRDKEFLTKSDQPKKLPLHGDSGSFAVLVARYSGDMSLGAIADELERTGVIKRADNTVKLNNLGYLPNQSEIEGIRIMSLCVSDLLETSTHNLDSADPDKRFQRQVIYNQMPEKLVEEFRAYSAEKSALLLQDLNRFLSKNKEVYQSDPRVVKRVGLGIYQVEGLHQAAFNSEEGRK